VSNSPKSFIPNQGIPPQWEDEQGTSFELLSHVARLYYLEGKTQQQVGQELGFSRQKVQRLLQEARELRIVEIHVHSVPFLHTELENSFKEQFPLRDMVIAPTHPDEQYRRVSVARAAGAYLERVLSPGMIVAVGLGRNASQIANFFRPTQPIDCTFVSAIGGSPTIGAVINPNQICATFAAKTSGKAVMLYAPSFVESNKVRDTLIEQEAIKEALTIARQANIAIMGIGTANDESILVRAGSLSEAEITRLRSIGAVGEVLGNYFDREGNNLKSDLEGRLIALSIQDLLDIPLVIVAASEPDKVLPVLAALRAGVIDTLVVDCDLAIEVLKLAGVSDLPDGCK
jgi:DNA-binding transcriptional regulator LsrR (DeoR family)